MSRSDQALEPTSGDSGRSLTRTAILLLVTGLAEATVAAAAEPDRLPKGGELYAQGCQSCHGSDGRGNPQWDSAVRPIEFTDCGTTSEATETWTTVVRKGGPSRGLDAAMPAFEGAYTDDEIGSIVAFIRSFCPQAERYPPGDLNFRRLLQTGKAFPEQEVVLRASHRPDAATRETEIEVLYENRLGPTFQYELVVPLRTNTSVTGEAAGLGDIELEGKQVLYFNRARRDILSVGLGLGLPTGDADDGLGTGTVAFTPFLAYGKAWGRSVVQMQAGAEIPADSSKSDAELRYRIGVSHALGPVTTAFTPALELVGAYNTRTHQHDYAVWGELSKPLNKLGHVIAAVGVQAPIRPRDSSWTFEMYLLWDFGDGPLWHGW